MRITIPGIITGMIIYWGIQHFTGLGNTGKGKAAG
jgi:hypothetical protein